MVYIISEDSGYIKVGLTSNFYKRLSVLQTGNPRKLSLLFWFETGSKENDRILEKIIHNEFRQYALTLDGIASTEWFDSDVLKMFDSDAYYLWETIDSKYDIDFEIEVHTSTQKQCVSNRRKENLIRATTGKLYAV